MNAVSPPRERSHRPTANVWVAAILLAATVLTVWTIATRGYGIDLRSSTATGAPRKPTAPRTLSTRTTAATTVDSAVAASAPLRFVAAARSQIGVTVGYDPTYVRLTYPGGDVPMSTGVCTDVLIRALRQLGIDLQVRIHEDMRANFSKYPRRWGLKKPDANIDHRRVPNLATYFARRGYTAPISKSAADYAPGDVVMWGVGVDHTGIVSDRKSADGTPLIIHNIGAGTQEENILFAWPILGHFRILS